MFENTYKIPLCVDLDGTLVSTDTLLESIVLLIKQNPCYLFHIIIWLIKGKHILKQKIASNVVLNVESLPFRQSIIDYAKIEKAKGRKVILATASSEIIANKIAKYLGIFDEVIASNSKVNLKGANKAEVLINKYGEFGFDYIGNDKSDEPVWEKANKAIMITPATLNYKKLKKYHNIEKIEVERNNLFGLIVKQLRINQWVKNILIFIPLLMAHKVTEPLLFLNAVIAFISFSFIASSVYIINDIFDLEADRNHKIKKNRPFASGKLSIKYGIFSAPILAILGIILSFSILNSFFTFTLLIYLLVTFTYTLILKKVSLLDILILAGLYTLRLFAGAIAVEVKISPWLLAFSMFLFLSLAIIKRYNELKAIILQNEVETNYRGYMSVDLSLLQIIGTSSGYLSVLIFILYINSDEVVKLYQHPLLLWAVAPLLLYWILRIWFRANRNEINEDPIVFTMRDVVSYIIGAMIAAIVVVASI